jgi:uncharacterized protein (DUF1330 family)
MHHILWSRITPSLPATRGNISVKINLIDAGNAQASGRAHDEKGYWVVAYHAISDEVAVKSFGALAVPAVQAFGGRFLTSSKSQLQAHEAGLPQRTVVVEFRQLRHRAGGSRKRGLPKGA